MTLYQLLDLSLSLSNRIDTHWALFISVHLALVGGIIYVDRPLLAKKKNSRDISLQRLCFVKLFVNAQSDLFSGKYLSTNRKY